MENELEEKLFREMTMDDLDEKYQVFAEVIGIDKLQELVRRLPGGSFYIPKKHELLKKMRIKKVREEFDGTNIWPLAIKYDFSTSYVYKIVGDKIKQGIKHDIKGQTNFFDLLEQ